MRIPIYQVDSFTDKVFGGNPAAVCPLEEWIETDVMQKIALENNLSETAFYVKKGDDFEIRWFTPKIEIDLAGHPTLAAAYVIFNYTDYNRDEIRFHTMEKGVLNISRENDLIVMDFPAMEYRKVTASKDLVAGLKKEPLEVWKGRDYLAVYENEETVLSIDPDFGQLGKVDGLGIIVTSEGDRSDFVSRVFVPKAGINEDPVTGSAHTLLVPFWSRKLGKNKLKAFQVSERRGELFCEFQGDRVKIAGKVAPFMKGTIEI